MTALLHSWFLCGVSVQEPVELWDGFVLKPGPTPEQLRELADPVDPASAWVGLYLIGARLDRLSSVKSMDALYGADAEEVLSLLTLSIASQSNREGRSLHTGVHWGIGRVGSPTDPSGTHVVAAHMLGDEVPMSLTDEAIALSRRLHTGFLSIRALKKAGKLPHLEKPDSILFSLEQYRKALGGRTDSRDNVLALTVAFEALLKPDKGEGIAATLAARCAWLVGQDAMERREIFDLLKELYDYRSDLVHTGGRRRWSVRPWREQIGAHRKGIDVYRRAALSLLLEGVPDWDDLVLDARGIERKKAVNPARD